jgi:hypothetical protein
MKIESLETLLPNNISISCYDAGATNIIINWFKTQDKYHLKLHLDGPAKKLWNKFFPKTATQDFKNFLENSELLISGTGWETNHEHYARKKALQENIFSVAVIDHWVNYKLRFERDEEIILPNEIWVTDKYAFSLARKTFPETKIRLLPNYYLENIVKKIRYLDSIKEKHQKNKNILYVLEPIRDSWNTPDSILGEFQALDFFISNINSITNSSNANIRLRLHPSESANKYNEWAAKQKFDIEISRDTELASDISWADIVVGCQTYVLIISVEADKKVISSLPKNAPDLKLPYSEIIELRNIL